jgi:hypothetical protein
MKVELRSLIQCGTNNQTRSPDSLRAPRERRSLGTQKIGAESFSMACFFRQPIFREALRGKSGSHSRLTTEHILLRALACQPGLKPAES